jgi:hypothetical protein
MESFHRFDAGPFEIEEVANHTPHVGQRPRQRNLKYE